jgi:general secretion pathway protein N
MRASPLLLTALLCLGTAPFASAQLDADIVAAPPENTPEAEQNTPPDADTLPAGQITAPAVDSPTTSEDQVGADEGGPDLAETPLSAEGAPPRDLVETVNPDQMLPTVGPPSSEDAPPSALPPPDQMEEPPEDVAPPMQAQPDAELVQPAPDGLQPSAGEAAAVDAAQSNPNPLSTLRLESLGATRSLPLFTPSRTPPVVAPAEPEQVVVVPEEPPPAVEAPPPPLQLIGIVMTDADQMALLRNTATGETLHLASGETFEEWTMKIVDARSIVFQSGDRVQDMKMFETFAPPPPLLQSGEPSGEPFDPGPIQDPDNSPPDEPLEAAPEPPPDGDIVIPHHQGAERKRPHRSSASGEHLPTGNSAQPPDPDAQILTEPSPMFEDSAQSGNFAPQLGNTPIPLEGALPDADQSGGATVNQ